MKWSIVAAVCIAVLGFIPLMGLPGAAVLEVGQFVFILFVASLLVTALMESLAHAGM